MVPPLEAMGKNMTEGEDQLGFGALMHIHTDLPASTALASEFADLQIL